MKVKAAIFCTILLLSIIVSMQVGKVGANGISQGVVINEIMYDPAGNELEEEYVELFNNASTPINLLNWTLSDQDGTGADFTFWDLDFPAGTYIVLHTGEGVNETDFSDGVAHFYMFKGAGMWGPNGDDALLCNGTGVGIDYVAYGNVVDTDPPPLELEFAGPLPLAGTGNSISLHPNGCDADSGSSWEESDPTPGRANSHLYDDPPVISNLRHSPQNPKTAETVTINATIMDDYECALVLLNYSLDGVWQAPQPMTPSGSNFSTTLPAYGEGTVISFSITAHDDAFQSTSSRLISYAHTNEPLNIVINEFLANPESDWNNDGYNDSDDEFIELYNQGEYVVNIGGWVLDDKLGSSGSSDPYIIPSGLYLEPGEYKVFFGNETGVILNDFGNESVALLDEEGLVIDIYDFNGTTEDATFGRYPDGSDNWEDFLLPTPGSENICSVDSLANLSKIVINEFLPDPKSLYSTEWIELYNSGTDPVRLDGCYLDDVLGSGTSPWRIPLGTTLNAGERIVFERNFGLNNAGDRVNLVHNDGFTVLDSYSYNNSENDISFARGGDGLDYWLTPSIPTPGESNPQYHAYLPGQEKIVICKLFYRSSEEAEFVALFNPCEFPVDIGGWRISDSEKWYSGTVIFPIGTEIPPKSHLYIANKATVFRDVMGFFPDFDCSNSTDMVAQMQGGEHPTFSMLHDEVRLLTEIGVLVDIVVYGDSDYDGPGWEGKAISGAGKGEVLVRNFKDILQVYEDTNTSSDWEHIRHYKVGQSDFEYRELSFVGNVTVFASPDSSFETIKREIENARDSIYVCMYEFTNWNLSELLVDKLKEGVEVLVLMEGSPVGGFSSQQKFVLQNLHEYGAQVRFMVTNATLGPRYNFVHAKYAVVDNLSLVISSENWKETGIPQSNTFGNRGWGAVIRNAETALYFTQVFFSMWSPVLYDIISFSPEDSDYGNPPAGYSPDNITETGDYQPKFPGMTISGNFNISCVIAPDSSLLEDGSVLGMINSAKETIYIQQLEIPLSWDDGEVEYENNYLQAALEAAEKRHVNVKILLSSYYAQPDDPDLDNYDTYVFINNYAENHNITEFLEARLVDPGRLGFVKVHNKGMVVDGKKTLISSINWNRNSVTQNREAGVIIENEEIASYFTDIFFWDWNEPPKANLGDDITMGENDAFLFEHFSSDSDGTVLTYFWDFDDGTNSTLENPTHKFANPGLYEVRLTISDGQYQDTDSVSVLVLEADEDTGQLGGVVYTVLLFMFSFVFIIIISAIRKMRLRFM